MRRAETIRACGAHWACLLAGALAVLVAIAPPAHARGAETGVTERWYVLRMLDERAGSMVARTSVTDEGNHRDQMEMNIRIERMGQAVLMTMGTGSLESPDGRLLQMFKTEKMAQQWQSWTYEFRDDGVLETHHGSMGETTKMLPRPAGDWLTPGEVESLLKQKLAEGAARFEYRTLDVTSGLQVVTITHDVVGPTNVPVMGKTIPGVQWQVSNSLVPTMRNVEWVDAEGELLRASIDMGGISMEILASEKEFATSDFDAPELMANMMVAPDRNIERPRETRRATYIVEMEGGREPVLAQGGAQRVERLDNTRARVVIDVDSPQEATEEELANPAYAAPSPTVTSDDPCVRGLVDRVTRKLDDDASPLERARAMERFVNRYVSDKSLGVGFATASEVCATREGDCSEHAVLLAAMLRADGIPSRTVSGLVYVDQFRAAERVFGFHMWTQGLLEVDGAMRWVDLDAAVMPMDATHIAISTSSLSESDVVNSMVSVATMLTGLSIGVEAVE